MLHVDIHDARTLTAARWRTWAHAFALGREHAAFCAFWTPARKKRTEDGGAWLRQRQAALTSRLGSDVLDMACDLPW